jgi:hypothetical protein
VQALFQAFAAADMQAEQMPAPPLDPWRLNESVDAAVEIVP